MNVSLNSLQHIAENCQMLCRECNRRKSDKFYITHFFFSRCV
ncbi:MAG: HNH endonuclease [Paludibacteraceae bacterium]|nr:HNH endonuclease [Paludibacteraceae bacterium]